MSNTQQWHLSSRKNKSESGKLTDRQEKILESIRQHLRDNGFAPTYRELASDAGLKSTSSVKHQLEMLEKKGYVSLNAHKGRAIELIGHRTTPANTDRMSARPAPLTTSHFGELPAVPFEDLDNSVTVPLVGRIAAGQPITAEQHVEDEMRLPRQLTGQGELFMLEVHGDSMIDAAICNHDFVVIRRQNSATNGDIVAALIDGEATVKSFENRNGHVWLMPHNPAYAPIDGTHASIMGKVVSVLRRVD